MNILSIFSFGLVTDQSFLIKPNREKKFSDLIMTIENSNGITEVQYPIIHHFGQINEIHDDILRHINEKITVAKSHSQFVSSFIVFGVTKCENIPRRIEFTNFTEQNKIIAEVENKILYLPVIISKFEDIISLRNSYAISIDYVLNTIKTNDLVKTFFLEKL